MFLFTLIQKYVCRQVKLYMKNIKDLIFIIKGRALKRINTRGVFLQLHIQMNKKIMLTQLRYIHNRVLNWKKIMIVKFPKQMKSKIKVIHVIVNDNKIIINQKRNWLVFNFAYSVIFINLLDCTFFFILNLERDVKNPIRLLDVYLFWSISRITELKETQSENITHSYVSYLFLFTAYW